MTDLQSTITCPECGHQSTSPMPTDACVYIHDCPGCRHVSKPGPGDYYVFCSYGTVPCPPVQAEVRDKSPENVSKAHSLRMEK